MNPTVATRFLLTTALSLCAAVPSFVHAAPTEQVLDLPAFRRALERRHQVSAKKDPTLKRDLKLLEKIVKKVPDFPGPWAALARLESRFGNNRRAEEDFREALILAGDWSGAAVWKADVLRERGLDGEAETLLKSAMSLRPDDAGLERDMAACTFTADLGGASRIWQGIYKRRALATDALFASARADFARKDMAPCRKKLETLLKIHPSSRDLLEWRIRAAEADGDAAVAAKTRETLAARGRDCDDLVEWVEGLTEGKPEKALALYSQAVSRYAGCAVLWKRLGLALENAGRGPEALAAYRRACGLGASDAYMASRIREMGGTEECQAAEKCSCRHAPSWRGTALKTLADIEKRDFQEERDLPTDLLLKVAADPDAAPKVRDWAVRWRNRFPVSVALADAAAWKTEQRTDRALEELRVVAETRPLDPRPYRAWCGILRETGKPNQGLELCDRWSAADLDAEPLLWRARFLLDAGRAAEAVDFLREVLDRNPENSAAWKELVRMHDMEKNRKGALGACRAWAQWTPLNREAWETWFKRLGSDSPEREAIQAVLKCLPQD